MKTCNLVEAHTLGTYLNPSGRSFEMALNSEIFIDKSGLIKETNKYINTLQRYMCVSRPRRFGKSMAMDMLAAYYGRDINTEKLFQNLKINQDESYKKHLNQYDVIKIDMQEFLSATHCVDDMIKEINHEIVEEFLVAYNDIDYRDKSSLIRVMQDVHMNTGRPFVILIDEWDCLFREFIQDKEAQKKYLDFLRSWLKDKDYIALAYMTGILPIKKYGSHSALNMFTEYSMTDMGSLAEYFGFTDDEVRELCVRYNMNFDEARAWYNGYKLVSHSRYGTKTYAMYSPKSVVEAMMKHKFGPYWNKTETYEALKVYIQMNMDGLKDAVVKMLGGESVMINTDTFANDMTSFATKDDVLTLLVHLGYLTYDSETEMVSIPNREVSKEYINSICTMDWPEVTKSIQASKKLLEDLWNMDSKAVAEGIDQAHDEISILQYNDENSLSCTINLAFYFAREYYNIVRELPTGKGFADVCFIPRVKHPDKPAVLIELKCDKDALGAIEQIKTKQYVTALKDYKGNLLLAGINYDKKTKKHECEIEKWEL